MQSNLSGVYIVGKGVRLLLCFVILLLFVKCENRGTTNGDVAYIEEGEWFKDSTLKLHFKVEDTSKAYKAFVSVINLNNYQYQNLYLFIEMKHQNLRQVKDTAEAVLANMTGKWLGSGMTQYYNKMLYLDSLKFKDTGVYNVSIAHGMREDDLKGIVMIGFNIVEYGEE